MEKRDKDIIRDQVIEEYWLNQLSGSLIRTNLPIFENTNIGKVELIKLEFCIPDNSYDRINRICKGSDMGIYIFLLTSLNAVLCRYSGNHDIVVGSTNFIIEKKYIEDNIILIRNSIVESMSFKELLSVTKKNVLDAFKYQNMPFYKILEKLRMWTNIEHKDIFNIAFISEAIQERTESLKQFDLVITQPKEQRNRLCFEFKNDVHSIQVIKQFAGHLINYTENALKNLDNDIHKIELLSTEDKNYIIHTLCGSERAFPKERLFHEIFEEQASKTPDNIAVQFENTRLTYKELNQRANKLAALLRERGMKRESLAAIMCERTINMLVGILGVLKSGGTYIPVDAQYPAERIQAILCDSGAGFLLTASDTLEVVEAMHEAIYSDTSITEIICLDCKSTCNSSRLRDIPDFKASERYSGDNLKNINMNSDLSYVIYTSGSTGKPKGAMVENTGMLNHLYAKIRELNLDESSIIAQNASHCFDISVWQFLAALMVGGKVVIYPNELILQTGMFVENIREDNISILEVVPTYLAAILDYLEVIDVEYQKLESLRCLLTTGEALRSGLAERWLSLNGDVKIINAYGPTEASDDITHYTIDRLPVPQNIPIGRPIQNLNIYIADKHMNLCPMGVKGEICVSGIGVGRGYIKDDERTNAVFMEDPFREEKGLRLYKTGDIGRWVPDYAYDSPASDKVLQAKEKSAVIEFFGRKDYQVKIRGFRVELGEIEDKLLRYSDINSTFNVKQAVVVDREDRQGVKHLCAYLVVEGELSIAALKEHLSSSLPDYMIPAHFIRLEKLPLNANGKIDRKILPSPEEGDQLSLGYMEPRDEVEKRLAKVWAEVLGISRVGINDDFFEIGGYSLKATEMISRVFKEFNVELPLKEVFKAPRVNELAEYIRNSKKVSYSDIPAVPARDYYNASSAQKRMYVLNQIEGINTSYNMPVVFTLEGDFDAQRFEYTIKELMKRHESFRTYFEVIDGEIVQKISEDIDIEISYAEVFNKDMEQIVRDFIKPFDLSKAPLFRISLVKNGETNIFMADMHHIISDGVSSKILTEEFIKLYQGIELPELRIQYKDFAVWQNEYFSSDAFKKQEEYWLNVFADEIPVLDMPLDYPRTSMASFEGDTIEFELDEMTTERLREIALSKGVTMQMTLLAIYNALLAGYTGQEDIVVGLPVAGRPHADLNNIIGLFVNTVALRSYPEGGKSFMEFLEEVKECSINAYANQHYQLEMLVERLGIRRDSSRNPVFDTVFDFYKLDDTEPYAAGSIRFVPYKLKSTTAKFDITFNATEAKDTVHFYVEYNKTLFRRDTMERFSKHFINMVKGIITDPQICLCDIDMITEDEREILLYGVNN